MGFLKMRDRAREGGKRGRGERRSKRLVVDVKKRLKGFRLALLRNVTMSIALPIQPLLSRLEKARNCYYNE